MEYKDIYVSNGKRPLWQTIIAAMLFTASLYFFYLFFTRFSTDVEENYKGLGASIEVAIFCIAGAIGFSRVVDYKFNLKDRSYRIIYNFGLLNFGKDYQFESIDYIAVYNNSDSNVIEVNLWYNKNKHFTMSVFDNANSGIEAAQLIAKKLNIDVWDATNPRNGFWLNID